MSLDNLTKEKAMKLRGIDFGNVLGASGVQGFFGEGYWFHRLWGHYAPGLDGITFVAKTGTLMSRKGNMPLGRDYTPRDLFPKCVRAQFGRGVMLNSVGLSNPGITALLETNKLQARTEPFWLSITSVAHTPAERLNEYRLMVEIIHRFQPGFKAPFGLQINLSCPNTDEDPKELIRESIEALEVNSQLGVPLMPKYSIASAPIAVIMGLNGNPHCDAICVSNAIPFGWNGIDWQTAWGSTKSPLTHLGGGALSGGKLLSIAVCNWIAYIRDLGFTKPINGGGGIMSPNEVLQYHQAGASSIFLGTVIPLSSFCPWRWNVAAIIEQANALDWG